MAKKPPYIPAWTNPKLSPLEAVMEWAFEQHHDKHTRNKRTLNIQYLLAAAERNPRRVIDRLPAQITRRLSREDRRVLIEALKPTTRRNALIHSRNVLKFMLHLFRRGSDVPPPWVS